MSFEGTVPGNFSFSAVIVKKMSECFTQLRTDESDQVAHLVA
ncbi:hypothetical protein B4096_0932 [Heyndrickxia coagulans]|nr:hypothetical protein B4096_0932 [Heyndrickxia coagulans]